MKIRFLITTEVHEDNCLRARYSLPSGEAVENPQPGDVFWGVKHDTCSTWDNCDGRHLVCVLPNGHWWVIDSRASNCTMPNDRTHRCWVRHGDPANGTLHVDKAGHTCQAGAGSIMAGDYHGFLHNGAFT